MDDVITIVVAIIGSGGFSALVNYFVNSREKKRVEESGEREAARLMMKDRLRYLCSHYIEQGWIYEDELEDLIAMHKCYHSSLNGNGFLDNQMDRVKHQIEIRGIGVK